MSDDEAVQVLQALESYFDQERAKWLGRMWNVEHSSFIELAGLTVPLAAWDFTWGLLHRGLELKADGDKLRVSGPGGARPELSEAEIAGIRRYKAHLLALITYQAPERTF